MAGALRGFRDCTTRVELRSERVEATGYHSLITSAVTGHNSKFGNQNCSCSALSRADDALYDRYLDDLPEECIC